MDGYPRRMGSVGHAVNLHICHHRPIGMFLFGILLLAVYRALVEDQRLITWRVVLYFSILTAISYEAFFSTLIPNMTKFGFTAVIGMAIVHFTARFFGYSKMKTA